MKKLSIGAAVAVAVALVAFSLVARAARPGVDKPHLASMEESASALARDGATMLAHGQWMVSEGQRTSDEDLVAHGEHWRADGEALLHRSQWLRMDPLVPSSLVTSPAELSAQGAWGDLPNTAKAMLHDPSKARDIDLEALRWNGLAMRAEGRNMAEHGRVMVQDADLMVARHQLQGEAAVNLRQAAQTMREVGDHLAGNGQEMIDYADRLRRSLGYP